MYKLLKMMAGEPLQIFEEDTELMSIKFYSQTLCTLNASLLDKKLQIGGCLHLRYARAGRDLVLGR